MGVMGGAGRQGGEGGDHRCRAEPAPQPTQGRRSRQQTQHWLPEICLPSLGTARGPGAAAETRFQLPPRKPGDSVVGSRSRLPAPARSSTPVVPRGPGNTTRTAGTAPHCGGCSSTGERERKLVCSTICWKTKTSDSLLHMQRNNTASPIDNQGDIKKTTVLQRPNSTS